MRRIYRIALPVLLAAICFASLALWYKPSPRPPLPAPAVATQPAAPQTVAEPDLVLDLFDPTDQSLAAQHSKAAISNQIEHTLVVTFLLTRCKLISQQDYSDTYNALIAYSQRTGLADALPAAAERVKQIASSASASYSLVYSRIPCDDASLPPLVPSLAAWRESIANRPVPAH